jgi:hypothetical protein
LRRRWGARGLLIALLALLAVAGAALAAGNVKAGRAYVGTLGSGPHAFSTFTGTVIEIGVSANGKTATAVAVYSVCSEGLGSEQVSFPSATTVHGAFKTTNKRPERAGLYATITVQGRFLAGGRASGTISGATNVNSISGGRGSVCKTLNPWSAKAKPAGFGVCDPVRVAHALYQDITDEHTTCQTVAHALKQGRYDVNTQKFSTPGWVCRRSQDSAGTPLQSCTHRRESFRFQVV